MITVKFRKFEWDWKGSPDWDEINKFIKEELRTIPCFYSYDTENDSYGVLVADQPLLEEEIDLLVDEN